MSEQDDAKIRVAAYAVETFVEPGMRLGLGSGSTSMAMVRVLGERVRNGLDIVGVATSSTTRSLALEQEIRVIDLDEAGELDLTLDGADEIDGDLQMIKGGGACLLLEKIVAMASHRMVAMVDETKLVSKLGAFPLPVEVVPFGWGSSRRLIEGLLKDSDVGSSEVALRGGIDNPLVTDSGNFILDLHCHSIGNPKQLAARLNDIPGVVENGLFIGIAKDAIVGRFDGRVDRLG